LPRSNSRNYIEGITKNNLLSPRNRLRFVRQSNPIQI
jgi:hypothetical protein